MKSVRIWSYSGPYFSAFGLNTQRHFVFRDTLISPYSVRMRENTDQNNSEYGHFSRSEFVSFGSLSVNQNWKLFILLYVKWVFSGYKSLSLNLHNNSWRELNVSDVRVRRTLSEEIFKRFWNNFEVLPPMIYDAKAIIWRISFIANIFEWTENPSLLEVSVRYEIDWFYGFHWRVKGRIVFPFNELLDR